ncbi:hypothetical protein [Magnetospirillum sulfuroxidans]|uniref:Sel1 repeat family protein n=1 Tax=Magnetospirillum sulfuroxidans TaxID=611300 RepID=A0ABS5I9N8_9PROT|nr:hypothetical protein [Magnetospirillum sulfuroxidans]MBR9971143.1 hypothetical protein [Magnetospirillum sulfuroxidans]
MPIKVEIIGDTPGQASVKIVGLGAISPGAGQMRLTRINSKTSLGADRAWHGEEQWLPLPDLFAEGSALLGRVGPELVDPLALLGPSDIVGMAVRIDGRTEEGRIKTDKLYGSHLHGAAATVIAPPPPEPEPTPEPEPEPEPEPVPVPEMPILTAERPVPSAEPAPNSMVLPLVGVLMVILVLAGGIAAYFLLFSADDQPVAQETTPIETKQPDGAVAPSEINTREDLAKYIQATPEPDKAYQTALKLTERGKLDFAMLLHQHAARGGNMDAAMAVAHMYDPESWSPQTSPMPQADAETAAYWYEPPAQSGNVEAQRQLGKIMTELTPSGFQHDKGREWLQKAADAGDAKAKELLGKPKGGN